MGMRYEIKKYSNAVPSYLENYVAKPFYNANLKTNLEGIAFQDSKQEEKSALEKMFIDRSKTLKAGVKALLEEIELRESLDAHVVNKIDDEISRHRLSLKRLCEIKPGYTIYDSNDLSKSKLKIENNLIELEREKRKEYLECWRDLMFLKKYLLSSLKNYWDLVKKREVLAE